MIEFDELIARLETATDSDDECDVRIHAARYDTEIIAASEGEFVRLRRRENGSEITLRAGETGRYSVARYTESIDDAILLVPEGWAWFAQWIGGEFSEGDARCWIPSQRTQGLLSENFDARNAANPAIALCIAALKARAALAKATGRTVTEQATATKAPAT